MGSHTAPRRVAMDFKHLRLLRGLPLPTTLLCLLAACAGGRYSIGGTTPKGDLAEVLVLGSRPRIRVDNRGPGELQVRFLTPDVDDQQARRMDAMSTEHRLRGPVRVTLEALGPGPAHWKLEAWNSTGLRADMLVEVPE